MKTPNRLTTTCVLGVAAILLLAACGERSTPPTPGTSTPQPTAAQAGQPQTTCPVMGGQVDKSFFADHDGKRVYFCCGDCIATFQKDPEKYLKKLADAGVTLDKAAAAPATPSGPEKGHEGHGHR